MFGFQLLLYICGSKEKYRQLRDLHALNAHMKDIRTLCEKAGYEPDTEPTNNNLSLLMPYDTLLTLVSGCTGQVAEVLS